MAEAITIPSPSLFLEPSSSRTPSTPEASASAKITATWSDGAAKRRPRTTKPPIPPEEETGKLTGSYAVTKRKQSKSRNGCLTCKAKRLKCDESKPTCQQCMRRNLPCGGYRKDFKWRPFEEVNYLTKSAPGKVKKPSPPPSPATFGPRRSVTSGPQESNVVAHPQPNSPVDSRVVVPMVHGTPSFPSPRELLEIETPKMVPSPMALVSEPYDPGLADGGPMHKIDPMTEYGTASMRYTVGSSSMSSGKSPRLVDLLVPGTDLAMPNPEYLDYRSRFSSSMFQAGMPGMVMNDILMHDAVDVEEVVRQPGFSVSNPHHEDWVMRLPSPPDSKSSVRR